MAFRSELLQPGFLEMLFFPDLALALYIQCFAPECWLLFVCHPLSHLPPMPTAPGQASQSHPRLHTPGSLFSGPCPELLPKKKKKIKQKNHTPNILNSGETVELQFKFRTTFANNFEAKCLFNYFKQMPVPFDSLKSP